MKKRTAKKTASAPRPRTYVTFLLDRSGSMSIVKPQTIEGFNGFLSTLKAEKKAEITFTFLQFDSPAGVEKFFVAEPIGEIPDLNNDTFQPRGGTPLIDAAYKTIKAVEEAIAKEEIRPKVVICIQTDGEENSSRDHTWGDLSQLVKAKQEEGWQFNFMGAGIDAYQQAKAMGIALGNTMSYGVARNETLNAFRASAQNTASFSAGLSASTAYSAEQKFAAGDKHDLSLAQKLKNVSNG